MAANEFPHFIILAKIVIINEHGLLLCNLLVHYSRERALKLMGCEIKRGKKN